MTTILDITPDDILKLDDVLLRELVARLCDAEVTPRRICGERGHLGRRSASRRRGNRCPRRTSADSHHRGIYPASADWIPGEG